MKFKQINQIFKNNNDISIKNLPFTNQYVKYKIVRKFKLLIKLDKL